MCGRTVFCLFPHQTAYVVPAGAVTVVPEDVPPARAVLAGTVETAVNALWDAAPLIGDRVAVVGAGMVGCCVARLLSGSRRRGHPRDVDTGRADIASALGVDFALPDEAADGATWSCTRARRPLASTVARPARARGRGNRPELVRRPGGPAFAGCRVPFESPRHPGEPGGHALTGAQGRRTTADRLALSL